MARIYLASSWRNEHQPRLVELLRQHGHDVYDFRNPHGGTGFSWSEIDPDWKRWNPLQYVDALRHPAAGRGFRADFEAMKWADTCVLLLPSGPSAAAEAGWCKGAQRRLIVHVAGIREPDLMYAMADAFTLSDRELLDALEHVVARGAPRPWSGLAPREDPPELSAEMRAFLGSRPEPSSRAHRDDSPRRPAPWPSRCGHAWMRGADSPAPGGFGREGGFVPDLRAGDDIHRLPMVAMEVIWCRLCGAVAHAPHELVEPLPEDAPPEPAVPSRPMDDGGVPFVGANTCCACARLGVRLDREGLCTSCSLDGLDELDELDEIRTELRRDDEDELDEIGAELRRDDEVLVF